jgi:23S rRNA (uridine2552-2'-O)-methyltransferase
LRHAPPIRRGAAVLDLGCWPGSWLQILSERVGAEGRVVGVDLEPTDAVAPNVTVLALDLTESESAPLIESALGRPADAVLCDAAPKLSGVRDVDLAAIEEIYTAALALARRLMSPSGFLVVKGFPGQESDQFRKELRRTFAKVGELRPEGKRSTSKEFYWLASTLRPTS